MPVVGKQTGHSYCGSSYSPSTRSIALPESLRDFVENQVKTRGYGNVSEYFRGLLCDAQQREADRRLGELLLVGLDSVEDIEISREFFAKKRTAILGMARRNIKVR